MSDEQQETRPEFMSIDELMTEIIEQAQRLAKINLRAVIFRVGGEFYPEKVRAVDQRIQICCDEIRRRVQR